MALVAVAILVFSGGAFVNLYNEQIDAVDMEMEAAASHLTPLSSLQTTYEMVDEMIRDQPLLSFALFDKDGRPQKLTKRMPEDLAKNALIKSGLHTVRGNDGVRRLAAFHQGSALFVLAYNLDEVEETFSDILLAFSLSLPIVLIVAAWGGWWVAGRALAPVRELIFATERIDSEQLDQRVPVTKANDELDRLAAVFNAMLDRLGKSFAQTKRFAADASHELRTPLTIMRGEIEQLLREPGILPNHEGKLLSLQEEIDRLDRITESLLLLTHLDNGSAALERSIVNLSALVGEACEDAEMLGASRQIRVEVNIGEDIKVLGDSVHLRRILLNLLDNATKFNVAGGRAQCVLSRDGEQVVLCVRNTGPGIPAHLSAHVFKRFFRADASRTGKDASHGLGLSLAREIARAHGGDLLYVSPAEPGWTEFVLTLPKY